MKNTKLPIYLATVNTAFYETEVVLISNSKR